MQAWPRRLQGDMEGLGTEFVWSVVLHRIMQFGDHLIDIKIDASIKVYKKKGK
jgi:hypothetical protein